MDGSIWKGTVQGGTAAEWRGVGFSAGSGDSAIPTAGHPVAQSDPVTAFQPGDRIWCLSLEPAAVQLRDVVKNGLGLGFWDVEWP